MKEIDNKIKAYYESKSLTKDQFEKIVNGQKHTQPKPHRFFLKYAAAFLLVLSVLFLIKSQLSTQESISEKYAKEVAFNHDKNLESDIQTPNIYDLNEKMYKLNFEIHIPENINNKYTLLGGRYCSIDQRLAAQLKLREKDTNSIVTLYVLDKLQNEKFDESFIIDSTNIQIWNEKTNLFVLASDTD